MNTRQTLKKEQDLECYYIYIKESMQFIIVEDIARQNHSRLQ